jgi:DNA-binding response OmpR family regulator
MARRVLLVVDDNREVCEVIAMALADMGTVECTHSAKDALKMAVAIRPALAIVDYMLPGAVDGAQLADQLFSMGTGILMTSGALDAEERLAELGYPFLTKPFHLADLARMVELLGREPQSAYS